jgi:hypothetical protein
MWTAIAPNEKFYAQRFAPGQTIDALIDEAYAKNDDPSRSRMCSHPTPMPA